MIGGVGGGPLKYAYVFRDIASVWKPQILYIRDRVAVKEVRVRIRDDGVGAEFDEMLSKMSLVANIFESVGEMGWAKFTTNSRKTNAWPATNNQR